MRIISSLLVAAAVCTSCLPLEATVKYSRFDVDPSQHDKPATIKVLLEKGTNTALLEVKGPYLVYDANSGFQLTSGSQPKRAFVSHDAKGIKWGHNFSGVHQIRLVPGDGQTSIIVNGTQYRGCVEIYAIGDRFNIINETDVETYLKSTLNSQFSDEIEEETMEAVVIAARTNAYFITTRYPYARWHVDAKEVGYQGYGATLHNLVVDRAVDHTQHVIMTHRKAPFAAAWTKNCAGKTADLPVIYRKNLPAPKGVESPLAAHDREKFRWNFSMSKKELASALGLHEVCSLDLFVDNGSNKVYGIRVGNGLDMKNYDFLNFQKKVGEKKLRSSDFIVNSKGESIVFTGYGDGPGVGLCLYTADKLAEKGEKAPKILAAFFPDTAIEKLRKLPSPDRP